MNKSVHILRSKRTGRFLLNPVGTFRGYGAYVGINPYREVDENATPIALGNAVIELMALSGPTGVDFKEAKDYLHRTADEETRRLRKLYGFAKKGMSTSKMAQRFLCGSVEQRRGQKSWRVQQYTYQFGTRPVVFSGAGQEPLRVRHADGPETLGQAVLTVFRLS